MGLKIKDAPDLSGEPLSLIFPGDSAVDQEKSDLRAWSLDISDDHLVLKADDKPAVITYRGLRPREVRRIEKFINNDDPNLLSEAFRLGCLSIGDETLGRERRDGLLQIPDGMLDEYSSFSAELHSGLLTVQWLQQKRRIDDARVDQLKKKVDGLIESVTLPEAVGVAVLVATFRPR